MPPKSAKKAAKKATEKVAEKPLPVTLLSGFLGSGKSSLLKHILENKEGMRVAVIMNEITEVNLDVALLEDSKLLQQEEKVVEMANGCICCTLREDLLLQLRELARSGKYDAVLIESSGIAEPMQVAETFFVDLKDGNGELQMEAPLDNCVTVIDASVVEKHMESLETIDKLDPTADTSAEGSQDIAALLFAQLEFANVVLLNKVDLLGASAKERAAHEGRLTAIVRRINPRAEVFATQHGRVDLTKILRTGNFNVEFAESIYNWMEDIKSGVKHVPETLEYGVSGFYWTAERPFHPKRLHDWLDNNFLLKEMVVSEMTEEQMLAAQAEAEESEDEEEEIEEMEEGDEESDDEEQEVTDEMLHKAATEDREKCRERYGNLFRSKGFLWIGGAERQRHLATWSQAGTILNFQHAGVLDDSVPPTQKLTFVGQNLKHDVLKADLEALLMTSEELMQLADDMSKGKTDTFEDPFEPFPPADSHSHAHEHNEDGTCKRPAAAKDGEDDAEELPKKTARKK